MAYWSNFSQETKRLMVEVNWHINIYAMLNRLKATKTENIYLPESVVSSVCKSYLKKPRVDKESLGLVQEGCDDGGAETAHRS